MTDQASKLAFLPLKPDLNLDDGEAKQALDSAFSTIAQQPGFKSLYWGRQIEHPDILQLVISASPLYISTSPSRAPTPN